MANNDTTPRPKPKPQPNETDGTRGDEIPIIKK